MKAYARGQRGLTTVEFAVVATVLFMCIFGVIEFGRLLWTYSLLAEGARRAARVAVVCPIQDAKIANAAMFDGSGLVPPGMKADNVVTEYLGNAGNVLAVSTAAERDASFPQIAQVRVRITGFPYQMIIPFVAPSFTTREFRAALPRESLGIPRQDDLPIGC